ncbi:MAG TPA: hypothetical protein VEH07_00485, partial [Alphaproteobacteria bacterium]|nr:hypothetical protein [Alphaproteobacteria bacterium]
MENRKTMRATAGPLEFVLEYRRFAHEQGWTIHLYGPRRGKREEILRFDCFDVNPHFHLGWSYLDRMFVPIPDTDDPLSWALEELRTHLPELLRESDAHELVFTLDT